ncbi:RING-type E3 ubiquitin transferase [Plasmodiophora brassicae]
MQRQGPSGRRADRRNSPSLFGDDERRSAASDRRRRRAQHRPFAMLCRFAGKCRNGDACPFKHDARQAEICPFNLAGQCSFGQQCKRVHGEMCPICFLPALHPFNTAAAEQHVSTCNGPPAATSVSLECAICFDTIAHQRIGLLTHCDHIFCLDCIRKWRSTRDPDRREGTGLYRQCPLCRTTSPFVIPSMFYVTGDAKRELIDRYVEKLKMIPCKYERGGGECRAQTHCMYKHTKPPTRHRLRSRRTRDQLDQALEMLSLLLESLDERDISVLTSTLWHSSDVDDDDGYY